MKEIQTCHYEEEVFTPLLCGNPVTTCKSCMQLCYKNTVNNLSLDLLFRWDEENWPRDVEYKLNPLSRKTDQHQISPSNINAL